MSNTRVTKLLVSKDVSVASSGATTSSESDGAIVAFKKDWVQLGASDDITDSDYIHIMQRVSSTTAGIGNLTSDPIIGTKVRNYRGDRFRPAATNIWYIGLTPGTTLSGGTGSITLDAGAEYTVSILNKAEKTIKQVPRRYIYQSSVTDTELDVATGVTAQINNDPDSIVVATVIGNGTGTNGLTSPTAYGIKIKGKLDTDYFTVGVNSLTGFGATPVNQDFEWYEGKNTITQLQYIEEVSQGNRGYYNRRTLPKTITKYIAAQSNSQLTSTSASGTIVFTQNSKAVTTGTGNISGTLRVGDALLVGSDTYFIASVTLSGSDTDSFTLSEPFKGSTVTITASSSNFSTSSISKYEGYNTIVIEHDSMYSRPSTDGNAERPETTIIAIPSKLANSSALSVIETCLDSYMASTPSAFASAGL